MEYKFLDVEFCGINLGVQKGEGVNTMDQNEKNLYASARPTEELFGLLERAQALDVSGLGYPELYERASRFLAENRALFFEADFLNTKANYPFSGTVPASFKVRILDPELDREVTRLIADRYHIKRVMTPFKLKTVLKFYVRHLEKTQGTAPHDTESLDALKLEAINLILQADKTTVEDILNSIKGAIK